MASDISGFGLVINIVASKTYPIGLPLTAFADDSDPLDIASIQIADKAMGLNGDLLKWSKAMPLPVVLSIIPNSVDDQALQVLANNNRVAKGKSNSRDVITMTIVYPDSSTVTLTGGFITDSPFGKSIASAGRMKTNAYAFCFENKIGA